MLVEFLRRLEAFETINVTAWRLVSFLSSPSRLAYWYHKRCPTLCFLPDGERERESQKVVPTVRRRPVPGPSIRETPYSVCLLPAAMLESHELMQSLGCVCRAPFFRNASNVPSTHISVLGHRGENKTFLSNRRNACVSPLP